MRVEGIWHLMEWKSDPQNASGKWPFNTLRAGYLFVQLSGLPDYKEWCTGWIYNCCLKRLTTGKKLCGSLSSVWMSTVQELLHGPKIISNSSVSISRTRAARKNTMIFDVHWLSCSFSVRRKNGFLFFFISRSETSLLTNFSFKSCIFCFVFCFTWLFPDFKVLKIFFSPSVKKKSYWQKYLAGVSAFPHRSCCEHLPGWRDLCWTGSCYWRLLPKEGPTSNLSAGRTLQTPMSKIGTTLFLAH